MIAQSRKPLLVLILSCIILGLVILFRNGTTTYKNNNISSTDLGSVTALDRSAKPSTGTSVKESGSDSASSRIPSAQDIPPPSYHPLGNGESSPTIAQNTKAKTPSSRVVSPEKKSAAPGVAGQAATATSFHPQQAANDTDLFFKTVPLEATMRDNLVARLARLYQANADLLDASRAQGLSHADASKLRAELTKGYQTDVIAQLGDQQGRYFLELTGAARFVPIAEDFAARCAAQGEPLSLSTLAAVAINLSKNIQDPSLPQSTAKAPHGLPFMESEAIKAATPILTPQQLEIFKTLWSEHPYPRP